MFKSALVLILSLQFISLPALHADAVPKFDLDVHSAIEQIATYSEDIYKKRWYSEEIMITGLYSTGLFGGMFAGAKLFEQLIIKFANPHNAFAFVAQDLFYAVSETGGDLLYIGLLALGAETAFFAHDALVVPRAKALMQGPNGISRTIHLAQSPSGREELAHLAGLEPAFRTYVLALGRRRANC